MGKIRIYEWAKKNKQSSAKIIAELKNKGHRVRNHTSIVDEKILDELLGTTNKVAETKSLPKEKTNTETKVSAKGSSYNKDDKKPYPKRDSKPFNKDNKKPFNKDDKKPFNKDDKKPFNKDNKKPYPKRDNKSFNKDNKRPFVKKETPTTETKPEETKKPTKKRTNNSNNKRRTYDRFNIFDKVEKKTVDDTGKTKTQLKKEAREQRQSDKKEEQTILKWTDDITVAKFAQAIEIPVTDVVTKLFELGIMATVNQNLSQDVAEVLSTEYNVEIVEDDSNSELDFENLLPDYTKYKLEKRPPVVTIMGHVDHGKTTLLDTLRNLNVSITAKEAGGITQHIGAYQIIAKNGEKITFLDTPGHSAFSQMRARGANITDITILVVAADDGVMPQTIEAITHAKSANSPIIVAVNKIDKPEANPEKILGELAEHGVMAEEWGGEVPVVKISALKGEGIDELLDYIKVIAEMHEYQAAYQGPGMGTVIESNLDKGRGPVATILLQQGTLALKDPIVIGNTWGTIRVLQDEYGKRHKVISPSMPVEITGLKEVPEAGDMFFVANNVKEAQEIGEKRLELRRFKDRGQAHALSLQELNNLIENGEMKELPVIIKADVHGSAEALASALEQIEVGGVKVRIVAKGVGAITESDVLLASANNTIIVGFNVRPDAVAKRSIEKENVELIVNNIIYKIIEQIEDSMKGMREKKYTEDVIGTATVEEVFKITGVGKVAGAIVNSGKITRETKMRLVREGVVLYDGEIGQLKRYKDDVKEVIEGQDFGVSFENYSELKKGDELEAYLLEEIEN
ncbi:MAG: translation initiation factor IF-2 [Mycoplasmatales bacterium]